MHAWENFGSRCYSAVSHGASRGVLNVASETLGAASPRETTKIKTVHPSKKDEHEILCDLRF